MRIMALVIGFFLLIAPLLNSPSVKGEVEENKLLKPRLVSVDLSPYCWGLALGDIFGNGTSVVLAGSGNRVVALSLENGMPIWESPALSGNVRKIAVGDVCGEGREEVFVATHDGHLYIIDAMENQILLDWDKSHFTNGAIFGLCVADIDSDGVNEVVVGTGTASISVYTYNSGLLYVKGMTMTQDAVFEVKIGDVDGDGREDIVFVDWRGNTESTVRVLDYYYGQFTQKFISPYIPGILSALDVEDLDGDGVDEIVAGSGDGNLWLISIGNLSGGSASIRQIFISHAQIFGVAIGDFEGDGIKDVACTTWDGYVYIVDVQKGAVRYRSEKRATDLGNSNSVLFYEPSNSTKEVFITTESGIPDINPGRVLFYATKNIEIVSLEYSPRFPEINQSVSFRVEIISLSANTRIEVTLVELSPEGNRTIGSEIIRNTYPGKNYSFNFTWIPGSPGYKSLSIECNADGEIVNRTTTVCVAVKMELVFTLGKYIVNQTLQENTPLGVTLTRGEIVEVSLRIVNHAKYTIFNLGVEIFIDAQLLIAKRFDISGSEEFSFKLDTMLITNGSFNLTVKSKLINPLDNTESLFSQYVISIALRNQIDYSIFLPYLIPLLLLLSSFICLLLLVRRGIRNYRGLWEHHGNFFRKE